MSTLYHRRVLEEAGDQEPSPSPPTSRSAVRSSNAALNSRERPVRSEPQSHVGPNRDVEQVPPQSITGDREGLNSSQGEKKLALDAKEEECRSENIDECAEAFIRRFKQQLQIQRLESIENYEQMLTRGL